MTTALNFNKNHVLPVKAFEPAQSIQQSTCTRATEAARIVLTSPTFWVVNETASLTAFTACVLGGSLAIPAATFGAVLGFGLAAIGFQIYKFLPQMVYETSLPLVLAHVKLNAATRNWWDEITQKIVLGGIPLESENHDRTLPHGVGIKAVLSVVEDFELRRAGLFTVPASVKKWKEKNVEQLVINVPDCMPVPVEKIRQAVDFLHKMHLANKKSYVHCKAGHGRSAAMVICYLLKHDNQIKSVEEAYKYVKSKRPQILLNRFQLKTVEEFARVDCGKPAVTLVA
jgi:protein-tyrosine phosphatase